MIMNLQIIKSYKFIKIIMDFFGPQQRDSNDKPIPFLYFTEDSQQQPFFIIGERQIPEQEYHQNCIPEQLDSQSESSIVQIHQTPQISYQKDARRTKKNSNAIKKIGRIILSQLQQYKQGKLNAGVEKMLKKLQQRKKNSKSNNVVDGFNTYHLQALFEVEEEISKSNLKTTRRIFTKLLRKEVLNSFQIKKDDCKLLYLNTLKCSSLRFTNRKLANRLQTSESQR